MIQEGLDAVLARQLQAQEDQAAMAVPPQAAGAQTIARSVQDSISKCRAYEDEMAQALALSVLPADELHAAAAEAAELSRAMGDPEPLAQQDALAQELLLFFKQRFFSWVNQPPCERCGGSTRLVGSRGPTAEEAAHLASRAEVYACGCGAQTAFPRYNDPAKLLETRRGRCGE